MPDVLMECGHVANAIAAAGGEPVCAICLGINEGARIVAKHLPDLTDRQARCSCGNFEPSSYSLAFFEFTGEGSRPATEICGNCRYAEVAHVPEITTNNKFVCDKFVPHGAWDYDRFYCGHAGWD
jgi:hypothetical protein